jgi:hypothetical protein
MQIKNVTQKDFVDVLRLNEESLRDLSRINTGDLQWFADNAAYFRTISVDKRLAGFLIGLRPGTSYASPNYRWFCDNYDDFAYIDRVAVAAWARRRGIAESFYNDFENSLTGVPVMTCEVNIRPPNNGSMQFHERQGFTRIGSQVIDDGEKEVALMEKRL